MQGEQVRQVVRKKPPKLIQRRCGDQVNRKH